MKIVCDPAAASEAMDTIDQRHEALMGHLWAAIRNVGGRRAALTATKGGRPIGGARRAPHGGEYEKGCLTGQPEFQSCDPIEPQFCGRSLFT